jgi:hypothetical protein
MARKSKSGESIEDLPPVLDAPSSASDSLHKSGEDWALSKEKGDAELGYALARGLNIDAIYSEGEFDWFFQAP